MQDLWKHIMERTFTFFQQKKGGGAYICMWVFLPEKNIWQM
jgi:hypothetical protein